MNNTDQSLSLTPPSKMNGQERLGALLVGIAILATLVTFLSGRGLSPWISLAFAGTMLVSGGVLSLINAQKFRQFIIVLAIGGILGLVFVFHKMDFPDWIMFGLTFGLISVGAVIYFIGAFGQGPAGIKNNGLFHSQATRQAGVISWILAILFTGFYVILYWFPDELYGLVAATDPLYCLLTGNHTYWVDDQGVGHVYNQWFLYGLMYTFAVVVMGFRFIMKYRHNRYQILRTISVATVQLVLAFYLPALMEKLNHKQSEEFKPVVEAYVPVFNKYAAAKDAYFAAKDSLKTAEESGGNTAMWQSKADDLLKPYEDARSEAWEFQDQLVRKSPKITAHYFSYFWPLGYSNLQPGTIEYYLGTEPWDNVHVPNGDGTGLSTQAGFGNFGLFAILFGLAMSTIGVVVLTYFFGKRWYCSWVCGCGGLAETAGDPFRHQSDKSLKAWRIERISIYSVLTLVTVVTALLLLDWKLHFLDYHISSTMKSVYGFVIGSIFAGVVGTGFYPILGSRVWCRFGCPQAAVLGILQKYFSRFRITTNGGQCISCGNCSTYCEMGIDVKSYAQRGQNIIRASCVGCGVCSAVCPRGVLNLENGPVEGRYNDLEPLSINPEDIKVNM